MAAEQKPFDHLFVGDAATGKSSILLRFTDDRFEDDQLSTIGVDLKIKLLDVEPAQPGGKPRRVKISIWDTAGQERFRTLTSSYYRGAQGVILVYDVTRRETFDNLEHWCKEIDVNTGSTGESGVVKILVGNKIDCPAEARQVSKREGEQWAREHGMFFIETSAKTRAGIQQVFLECIMQILNRPKLLAGAVPANVANVEARAAGEEDSGGGCC